MTSFPWLYFSTLLISPLLTPHSIPMNLCLLIIFWSTSIRFQDKVEVWWRTFFPPEPLALPLVYLELNISYIPFLGSPSVTTPEIIADRRPPSAVLSVECFLKAAQNWKVSTGSSWLLPLDVSLRPECPGLWQQGARTSTYPVICPKSQLLWLLEPLH